MTETLRQCRKITLVFACFVDQASSHMRSRRALASCFHSSHSLIAPLSCPTKELELYPAAMDVIVGCRLGDVNLMCGSNQSWISLETPSCASSSSVYKSCVISALSKCGVGIALTSRGHGQIHRGDCSVSTATLLVVMSTVSIITSVHIHAR